jgi:hypothetical protein
MSYDPSSPASGTTQTTPLAEQRHDGGNRPPAGVMTQHGRPGVYIYPFWQRTEFWVMTLTSIAILIATAIEDGFPSQAGWTLITILGAAYIVSRGLAKREPRDDSADRPWTPGS